MRQGETVSQRASTSGGGGEIHPLLAPIRELSGRIGAPIKEMSGRSLSAVERVGDRMRQETAATWHTIRRSRRLVHAASAQALAEVGNHCNCCGPARVRALGFQPARAGRRGRG